LLIHENNFDTKEVVLNNIIHRKTRGKSLLFICLLVIVGIAPNYSN
jgi:hypothetical protein